MDPKAQRLIRCPRCGYDQRGVVATWAEHCPLDGVCTECGLTFTWAELLNPELAPPRWCVEAQRRPAWFPAQAFATLIRTLWPWRLWSGIRMTHQPRWLRLALYLVLLTSSMYVPLVLACGLMSLADWQSLSRGPPGITITSATSALKVFAHALAQPWSDQSAGSVAVTQVVNMIPGGPTTMPMGTFALPSPRSHLLSLFDSAWSPILVVLAIPVSSMLAFAALPISRRIAKVQWWHLRRATVYAYGLIWIVFALSLLDLGFSRVELPGTRLVHSITALYWLAAPVLMVLFWWAAASRYLRMTQGLAVGASVTIIGILLPFSVSGFLWVLID